MTSSDYTESALVERPAIALLEQLGWEAFDAYGEFDLGASSLGRENKGEVILKTRLRLALLELNPESPVEAIHEAIDKICKDRSRMSLAAANKEIYDLIKNGVRVNIPHPEGDGESVELVRVIDWDKPENFCVRRGGDGRSGSGGKCAASAQASPGRPQLRVYPDT